MGGFSTKSIFSKNISLDSLHPPCSLAWRAFCWSALERKVLSKDVQRRRVIAPENVSLVCSLCRIEDELVSHLSL